MLKRGLGSYGGYVVAQKTRSTVGVKTLPGDTEHEAAASWPQGLSRVSKSGWKRSRQLASWEDEILKPYEHWDNVRTLQPQKPGGRAQFPHVPLGEPLSAGLKLIGFTMVSRRLTEGTRKVASSPKEKESSKRGLFAESKNTTVLPFHSPTNMVL